MYYTTESQLLFIQHINAKTQHGKMAEIFGQSKTGIAGRSSKIRYSHQIMHSLGITIDLLENTIIECNGDIKYILKKFKIRTPLLMSFLNSNPEIHCKINGDNELWNYFSERQSFNYVNLQPKKRVVKNTPKPKHKIVTISDTAMPKERNYLRQAEEILGGRITKHPKLGMMLDGERKTIKQILEAANITDHCLYA